jgi:hypothetical protein
MPSILATQYWVMKPMGELQGQHWPVCFHVLHHQIRECCGSLLQDCNVLVCMLSLLGMSGALCQHWIQKCFHNSMFIGFSMCFSWDFNRNFTTSEPRVDDFMDWWQVYTSLDTGGTQFHLCSTSGLWRYMAHLKTTWLSKLHSTKEPYAADEHNLHHSWKPFVHNHCRNLHARVELNSTYW